MEKYHLYIVFSSTPYRIGRLIRGVTRQEYNHVSIALDQELSKMYGFARRYYKTPFFGGFVHESPSRYCPNGIPSRIKICRIPVTQEQHEELETRLLCMHRNKEQYLYNYISLLGILFRRRIPVRDAYLCIEFAVDVLHEILPDTVPKVYSSVHELEQRLEDYTTYIGPIPQPNSRDDAFYAEKPLPHPLLTSLRNILALFPRLGSNS